MCLQGSILWSQFSAILPIFGKTLAFFSKTNDMINFLKSYVALVETKTPIFCPVLGENILRLVTSAPGLIMYWTCVYYKHICRQTTNVKSKCDWYFTSLSTDQYDSSLSVIDHVRQPHGLWKSWTCWHGATSKYQLPKFQRPKCWLSNILPTDFPLLTTLLLLTNLIRVPNRF
jgi:hypothetical protein